MIRRVAFFTLIYGLVFAFSPIDRNGYMDMLFMAGRDRYSVYLYGWGKSYNMLFTISEEFANLAFGGGYLYDDDSSMFFIRSGIANSRCNMLASMWVDLSWVKEQEDGDFGFDIGLAIRKNTAYWKGGYIGFGNTTIDLYLTGIGKSPDIMNNDFPFVLGGRFVFSFLKVGSGYLSLENSISLITYHKDYFDDISFDLLIGSGFSFNYGRVFSLRSIFLKEINAFKGWKWVFDFDLSIYDGYDISFSINTMYDRFDIGLVFPISKSKMIVPAVKVLPNRIYTNKRYMKELNISINLTNKNWISRFEAILEKDKWLFARREFTSESNDCSIINPFGIIFGKKRNISIANSLTLKSLFGDMIMKDGSYMLTVRVVDQKGREVVDRGSIIVDTIPPQCYVVMPYNIFTPNNDGIRDTITITNKTSNDDFRFYITDGNNRVVRHFVNTNVIIWEGSDDNGNLLPDGDYYYNVVGCDNAGNCITNRYRILLTRERERTYISSDTAYIGKDSPLVVFSLYSTSYSNIVSWKLNIIKGKGVVRSFDGKEMPPEITWDGRDKDNTIVEDGVYKAMLDVIYKNGNRNTVYSSNIVVDNTPPVVELSIYPYIIVPDNDGIADKIDVKISIGDKNPIKKWELVIKEGDTIIRKFAGSGNSGKLRWDGKKANGEFVCSCGEFHISAYAVDMSGNIGYSRSLYVESGVFSIADGNVSSIRLKNINESCLKDVVDVLQKRDVGSVNILYGNNYRYKINQMLRYLRKAKINIKKKYNRGIDCVVLQY